MRLFTQYRRLPWLFAVFVAAFAFFLLTGAWAPYPGESAAFVAALRFPGQAVGPVFEPFDTAVMGLALRLLGPVGLGVFAAALGAWAVTMLFVAAVEGVRHASLDLLDLREEEVPRAGVDMAGTALLAGFATAVLAATALPLWALGTRPLPAAPMVALCATLVALAMALRRKCAEDYVTGQAPSRRRRLGMGLLFAGAVFLFADDPGTLPLAAMGLLLGGGILIRQGVEGRTAYLPWIVGGIVLGLAGALASAAAWFVSLGIPLPDNLFLFWCGRLQTLTLPAVRALLTTFDGVSALALFGLALLLLLGTFPRAFFRLGAPFVGQLAIVALAGLSLARWPFELWGRMAEPTPLMAMGVALLALDVGLLIGSWVRHWMDARAAWSVRASHVAADAGVALFTLALVAAQVWRVGAEASGCGARQALRGVWAPFEARVPASVDTWLSPDGWLAPFFLWRQGQGEPLRPVANLAAAVDALAPAGARAADPALDAAAELGGAPFQRFLLSTDTAGRFREGPPLGDDAAAVEAVAAQVEASPFGWTGPGRRFVGELRAAASRGWAILAQGAAPKEAAGLLRHALALNPENAGAALSLAALAAAPEAAVTAEERRAARRLGEDDPWLLAPTPAQAEAFERAFGPVGTVGFRAARRLRALEGERREETLAEIVRLYREDPRELSQQERLIALLRLPQAEAATLLERGESTDEDVAFFLCAYPWSDAANALFARYEARLMSDRELGGCLSMLYHNLSHRSRAQRLNDLGAYFIRQGRFVYAYVYLRQLIEAGREREALRFVSDFAFGDRLASSPYLMEALRVRALEAAAEADPAQALAAARTWLIANPAQSAVWGFVLRRDPTERDVRDCLRAFPAHPVAVRLFGEALRGRAGDAAAERWLGAMLSKEPAHADR